MLLRNPPLPTPQFMAATPNEGSSPPGYLTTIQDFAAVAGAGSKARSCLPAPRGTSDTGFGQRPFGPQPTASRRARSVSGNRA